MGRLHKRINGKAWLRVRRLALDRDGWRCQGVLTDGSKCLRPGRLEIDHIVPLDKDGAPLELSNLQALCRPCHFAKTGAENSTAGPERLAWSAVLRELLE